MAGIKERITDDGDKPFAAYYRDPEGRQRSAGTFSCRRATDCVLVAEGERRLRAWMHLPDSHAQSR
jgi:hypothetical protein